MDFTEEQLLKIKQLFDEGLGARRIAKALNISRFAVQQAYKRLLIYNIGRKKPKTAKILSEKICKTCKILKPIHEYRARPNENGSTYYQPYCKLCEAADYNKRYEEYKEWQKQYLKENKDYRDERNKKNKEWREKNKEKLREYRDKRKAKDYINKVRWIDRKNREFSEKISYYINQALKVDKQSKEMKEHLKFLPYTIDELKAYLEKQFEPWMNWKNKGRYTRTWNDNDSSTWAWQIDHIIPQSDLPYNDSCDDNFKTCWSLENLRPLSAKQNLFDGIHRTRHKKT